MQTDVIYENLETSADSRMARKFVTFLVMFCLLIGSIIVLAIAQYNKAKFQASVPSFSVCDNFVKLAYDTPTPASGSELTYLADEDDTCPDGEHFLTFMNLTTGVTSSDSLTWGCPLRSGVPNRCVGSNDKDICSPAGYPQFLRSAIPGCYCKNELSRYLSKYGVFNGAKKLWKEQRSVCLDFAVQYFIGNVLLVFAALMIVVINSVLKVCWLLWVVGYMPCIVVLLACCCRLS